MESPLRIDGLRPACWLCDMGKGACFLAAETKSPPASERASGAAASQRQEASQRTRLPAARKEVEQLVQAAEDGEIEALRAELDALKSVTGVETAVAEKSRRLDILRKRRQQGRRTREQLQALDKRLEAAAAAHGAATSRARAFRAELEVQQTAAAGLQADVEDFQRRRAAVLEAAATPSPDGGAP